MHVSQDFKTLLAGARLPERTVPICLRGDLVAEFETLDRQLEALTGREADSLEGNGSDALAERIEALRQQMRDASYTFRLRALARHEFRQLFTDHPPRRDPDTQEFNPRDVNVGVNMDTFFDALIQACTVDPQLTDDQWVELLGAKLTDRQHGTLADAAWYLNRGEVNVPFSQAASLTRRNIEPA
jgi:hypothetical protein